MYLYLITVGKAYQFKRFLKENNWSLLFDNLYLLTSGIPESSQN